MVSIPNAVRVKLSSECSLYLSIRYCSSCSTIGCGCNWPGRRVEGACHVPYQLNSHKIYRKADNTIFSFNPEFYFITLYILYILYFIHIYFITFYYIILKNMYMYNRNINRKIKETFRRNISKFISSEPI